MYLSTCDSHEKVMTCTKLNSRRERHDILKDATGLQWSSHDTINVGGAGTSDDGDHGDNGSNEQRIFNKGDLQHCSLRLLTQWSCTF